VNARDPGGATPLHAAIRGRSREAAELLLAHDANANAKDRGYRTPLCLAVSQKNRETAELLLEHGANPQAKQKDGRTALDLQPALADIVRRVEAAKAGH
jgi:ankyrin repeat protein